ncbi:MAG: cyclic nucleotide-binding domain-containing protein [bacterium]
MSASGKSDWKEQPLFSGLGKDVIEAIGRFAERRKYLKGDKIYLHNQKAEKIYLLLEGSVHLRTHGRDYEAKIVVSRVGGGDLFGVGPLLGSGFYTLEAYCAEDSEVLGIDAGKLGGLLEANSKAGSLVMGEVAKVYFERYIGILNRLQKIISQIPLVH